MESNNTGHHSSSIGLFIFGQISYVLSILTSPEGLELLFKFLSVVSVFMVIIINLGKFINAIKNLFKSKRKEEQKPNDYRPLNPSDGSEKSEPEQD